MSRTASQPSPSTPRRGYNAPFKQQSRPQSSSSQNPQGYTSAGGVTQQKHGAGALIAILLVMIIIIFTIAGIALATHGTFSFKSSTPQANNAPGSAQNETPVAGTPITPPSPPAEPQMKQITAAALSSAYSNDFNSAVKTYEEEPYMITGTIAILSSESPPYIIFNGGAENMYNIKCTFLEGLESSVSALSEGQSITIQGIVTGYDEDLMLIVIRESSISK